MTETATNAANLATQISNSSSQGQFHARSHKPGTAVPQQEWPERSNRAVMLVYRRLHRMPLGACGQFTEPPPRRATPPQRGNSRDPLYSKAGRLQHSCTAIGDHIPTASTRPPPGRAHRRAGENVTMNPPHLYKGSFDDFHELLLLVPLQALALRHRLDPHLCLSLAPLLAFGLRTVLLFVRCCDIYNRSRNQTMKTSPRFRKLLWKLEAEIRPSD